MGTANDNWGGEFSYIQEKGEIGYIDYEDDKSVCSYNPEAEGPIVISVPFPFVNGKPQSMFAKEIAVDSITLKNTTDEAAEIWIKIYSSSPEDSFTLSLMKPPSAESNANTSQGFAEFFSLDDRMLQPGENLTIWVSCKPKEIGMHTTVLHFDVGGDVIERVVFLLAEDKISKSLMSQKPYSKGLSKKHFSSERFITGGLPARRSDRPIKKRLPLYSIPQDTREIIENRGIPEVVQAGLTRANYVPFFKNLIVMEELQLEQDMRSHNLENVTMGRKGNFLSLVVSGLAERRPSLVTGDFIFAKLATEDESVAPFQGYIHRVEADEIHLKFAQVFHRKHVNSNVYSVQFTYNRINSRRLYLAVEATENLEAEFLFPSEFGDSRTINTTSFTPASCLLNEEQTLSVQMILGCKGGPPYVIHGPPGTGKTLTIVEAIIQLYRNRKGTRILVCAPSNSAADYLLEKIVCEKAVDESEIFRLNASARSVEELKPELIPFCSFDGDSVFTTPPTSVLAQFRIIVSTYMSASLLYSEGFKRGHFSHIFLDEAGQASEPESMIPISNLCRKNTVVVLAGDPMQLGPVIYSKKADNYGFGKSFLERLFESEQYYHGNGSYVTKLIRNYRCHPEILYLPSTLFYEGELIASKENTSSFMDSVKFLPNRNFPVLFYGIQGCDEREGSNPSWFNRIEASKVVEVIQELMESGNLNEKDIGVITPYRQQVLKLKKALEHLDIPDITVGSVEQFQGQERQVIIISTVRSTIKHNEFDRNHCLGFLSNPRRFNVAITRAIALLIIIGNPHIISKDPYWNQLLWRCVENDSYKGCILPEREVSFEEVPQQPEYSYYEGGENPQPSGNGAGHEEYFQPDGEWNQGCYEGDKNQQLSADSGGHQDYAWNGKPCTNEDEWSDGWK